jgi:molybdenum cofactor biosynthesis enzyme MoaA
MVSKRPGRPVLQCHLLHVLEQQDQTPYEDPDVKDVIGIMPQFFCTHCNPIRRLRPSEAYKCMQREDPCWKPADRICAD